MVLLQVGQLLLQVLDLHLQVGPGQGQLVQHPAQPVDVGLHALAQEQLVLIPAVLHKTSVGNARLCMQWSLKSKTQTVPVFFSPVIRAAKIVKSITKKLRRDLFVYINSSVIGYCVLVPQHIVVFGQIFH